MDIVLIPGLWLDASSWDEVVPELAKAGHGARPLTLPGMESRDSDRSAITLRDHVASVVEAIDAVRGPVVLVGHSAGCGVAYAAVDARPDHVARAIYVAGFPTADGDHLAGGFATDGSDLPMPDWSEFDAADLVDMDDEARAEMRARAIPSPAGVLRDRQQLSDERRYDVPVTAIATEYTSEMLRSWIDQGMAPVREFAKFRDLEYIDLPTGHWPQFTRPTGLARAILASIDRH